MSHPAEWSDEHRDILLTAYALGELAGDDLAAVERLLADPHAAAARAHVAEVRATAAALKAGLHADAPERSPELRRAVFATAVGRAGAAPGPLLRESHAASLGKWALALGSCAAAALLFAVIIVPAIQPRGEASREVALSKATNQAESPVRDEASTRRRAAEKARDGAARKAQDAVAETAADALPATASVASESTPPAASPAAAAPLPEEELLELETHHFGGRAKGMSKTLHFGGASVGVGASTRSVAGEALPNTERYNRFSDNRLVSVAEQPLSTFSIDVDTASYANVRRFLTAGQRPPQDAVRIEELVNYFRYDYPQPREDAPFSVTVEAAACPWRQGHRLVRVGLQGRDVARDARPAGNLVFLVDVSGSMDNPDKLPLVQRALEMLVEELTENDRVAIVTYAGNAGLVLPSTSGGQKETIRAAIAALQAGGSTHGSAGITLAYEQAAERFIPEGANRVILCTDGDLNVGVTSDEALVELIKQKAAGGTFLTVLGFGTGNLQDEKMEKIADNGNGVYAYIDGAREARKVLVEQLTGSTIAIAKDVKIQVEFNPAQVASYRLIGYENRALAAEDFRDDKKDAGEIGAGHAVTALYEVVLVGDEAAGGGGPRGAEPLKYQPAPAAAPVAKEPVADGPVSRELLTVKLRWKKPEAEQSSLLEVPLSDRGGSFDAASADLRFAAAVAAFGMILRDREHRGSATLPLVAGIAGGALGRDEGGYRAEFLDLVRKAEAVFGRDVPPPAPNGIPDPR